MQTNTLPSCKYLPCLLALTMASLVGCSSPQPPTGGWRVTVTTPEGLELEAFPRHVSLWFYKEGTGFSGQSILDASPQMASDIGLITTTGAASQRGLALSVSFSGMFTGFTEVIPRFYGRGYFTVPGEVVASPILDEAAFRSESGFLPERPWDMRTRIKAPAQFRAATGAPFAFRAPKEGAAYLVAGPTGLSLMTRKLKAKEELRITVEEARAIANRLCVPPNVGPSDHVLYFLPAQ